MVTSGSARTWRHSTNELASATVATTGMIAGLRLAVSGTDVVSMSASLGEHYFTKEVSLPASDPLVLGGIS